jgi:hypothetical protein
MRLLELGTIANLLNFGGEMMCGRETFDGFLPLGQMKQAIWEARGGGGGQETQRRNFDNLYTSSLGCD